MSSTEPPVPASTGRPSTYSDSIVDEICERLSDGESLKVICDDDHMPSKSTVFKWLAERDGFSDRYARAREAQADALFDDILSIADDGRNDWMEKHDREGENIGWRENGEAMRRSQLRIDARKWMAGKLRPKKYGDKLDINHSGSIEAIPDDVLDVKLSLLLRKAGVVSADGREGPAEEDDEA